MVVGTTAYQRRSSQQYEQIAERELGKECAYWLRTGRYLDQT